MFPSAGHFIHEDQAEQTALVVADFYRRNDRSALVLPPKVGPLAVRGEQAMREESAKVGDPAPQC